MLAESSSRSRELETSRVDEATIAALRDRLLPWYAQHRRDLPWRRTRDPYKLVAAELMLQQTGVDRIAPRWTRFVERFPSWQSIASASVGDVIREWQGLGYNRRAVSLHRMAVAVVEQLGGELPRDRDELLKLPGVGPYTANAIMSFVHDLDVPAIDVNLQRVIGRVALGDPKAPLPLVEAVARAALPAGHSSDWNQALMDFASIQCTLRRPACLFCPLRDVCRAAGAGEGGTEAAPAANAMTYARADTTRTRAAERRAPYLGSTRFLRGRIVDLLRQVARPDGRALESLAGELGSLPEGVDVATLVAGLVRDGLVEAFEEGGVALYRLP